METPIRFGKPAGCLGNQGVLQVSRLRISDMAAAALASINALSLLIYSLLFSHFR
jgi:hypothetical protein